MIRALGVPLLFFAATAAIAGDRPNVVFILADDLGWRDLSNEGSAFYESPHIDRIAREGMRFTRGYAACSVCSPSRASILTGKYPTKHGITSWIGDRSGPPYEHALRAGEITLAEALHDAGYKTFFAGKWHLGGRGSWPTDHGFDINRGGWDAGSPRGGYFAPWKNPNLESGPNGQSLPIRLARETASFIEANRDGPFFACLAFYSVHGPIQTTKPLWKKYRDKAVAAGLAGERFAIDGRICARQVQDCPVYAGMIESMDNAVGMVLKKLDDLGLADNTIVCFTSDNGGVVSGDCFSTTNRPLRGGKGVQWEGGIREPYYIKAPGIAKAGSTSAAPVSGIDWYPTLLELCGVPIPQRQDIDGVSLVPLLQGGSIADRPLFWHFPHYSPQGGEPSSIITEHGWKLIHYHEDGRDELYHLAADPGEQKNLVHSEPGRAKTLRAKLDAWLKATGATFPKRRPMPNPAALDRRAQWLRKVKDRQEKRAAEYLEEDYEPNKNWWGSLPRD